MATLAPTRPEPGIRAATGLVLLLGAAIFLNYVDRGAIAVAAPLMKSELRLSATGFGLAVSAFFWVYAPVQLFAGWLCDRFSVYKLVAAGIVLWAASTFLMGFAGGFLSLLVLRVMLGVGESIAFPGASKIIARHVPPERRGFANATVAAGLALGPAAGTLAGGLIVASFGWRVMFFAFGVATLLWLAPWRSLVVNLPKSGGFDEGAPVPLKALLGKWSLWSMAIVHCLGNYSFYFILTWLPLYLTKSRGFTITEMTLLATLGYAVQAACALGYGHLSDRWTRSGRSEAACRRAMMIGSQMLAAARHPRARLCRHGGRDRAIIVPRRGRLGRAVDEPLCGRPDVRRSARVRDMGRIPEFAGQSFGDIWTDRHRDDRRPCRLHQRIRVDRRDRGAGWAVVGVPGPDDPPDRARLT